eukprot:COSAG06_NODE_15403_length_1073_cov_1.086242_2_plen_123_part_00
MGCFFIFCRVLGANNMPLIVYQLMKNLDMKVTNVMVRENLTQKKTLNAVTLRCVHCLPEKRWPVATTGAAQPNTSEPNALIKKRKCVFFLHTGSVCESSRERFPGADDADQGYPQVCPPVRR